MMKARSILVSIASLVLIAASTDPQAGLRPEALVERAFANLYGFSSSQRIELRARQADGKEFVRKARVLRRGSEEGLNRMLVRFVSPQDLRGVGVLLHERPDHSYDAFLYQPIYKMVRRISVAQRRDAFFGTDVTFEDLEAKRASQWAKRHLRTEAIAGRETSVIELSPDGFPSGYERVVGWFDRTRPIMLRAEFFRAGKRVKVLEVDSDAVLDIDGHLVPSRMVFRGERGSVTTLELSEIDLRDEIPDQSFSRGALEFGDDRSPVWEGE
jgi:hypothetical protein